MIKTPAYIIDTEQLRHDAGFIRDVCRRHECKLVYPLKTCSLRIVLERLRDVVDGFAASSVNEARLADEVLQGNGSLHFTSPGVREDDIPQVVERCSHISANSLHQLQLFGDRAGLRINPCVSIVDDERFDPCRPHSKLGVPLDDLPDRELCGIHFHTASESRKTMHTWVGAKDWQSVQS